MVAVTVSRQRGSLGERIAEEIAARLGCRVVWREVVDQAARQVGAPEMILAEIDDLGLLGLSFTREEQRAYHQAMTQVMEDLVAKGNVVIIGRAGQVILRDYPGVFHVQIVAPVEVRAGRLSQELSIPIAAARAQVKVSDRRRREYLRRAFRARWDDPTLYDLVLNTARLTPDLAAGLVCQAVMQCMPSCAPADAREPAVE